MENRVSNLQEFYALLNSGKLKRGDVILWEEMGTQEQSLFGCDIRNDVVMRK